MSATAQIRTALGTASRSPAGPIDTATDPTAAALPEPPALQLPRAIQTLRFNQRQIQFVFRARRLLGDTFLLRSALPNGGDPVVTAHPDHVQSLFTAKPHLAPSLTGESPLRPIVGPNSVITALGARHMRQRKLLLPTFHGEAIARYEQMIADAADAEIDRWPIGTPFALAPRMQAITLDVIMSGIFGIDGAPRRGTPEHALRTAIKNIAAASMHPLAQWVELMNSASAEPVGLTKLALGFVDRPIFGIIAARRRDTNLDDRNDILSLLLQATTEEGEHLSDQELRDELLSLVLAGHETTANSLAWAWERLTRHPDAYMSLRDAVRTGDDATKADHLDAVIHETMRSRPVIPLIGRRVTVPWRFGEHAVPADTAVLVSILLIHHRDDLYPEPFAYRPERWLGGVKPGTYTWLPFGGGIRRCLGVALAMAEQRVVLETMTRRLDLEAADQEAERALHRNVTMIPSAGARVIVRSRAPR